MVQSTRARIDGGPAAARTISTVWALVLRSLGAFAAALAMIYVLGAVLRQPLMHTTEPEIMRTEYSFNAAELPNDDSALESTLRGTGGVRSFHIDRAGSKVTVSVDHLMGSFIFLDKSSLFRLGYLTERAPEERTRNLSAEKRAASNGLENFASWIPFQLAIPAVLIAVTCYLWFRRAREGGRVRDLFTRTSWRQSIGPAVAVGAVVWAVELVHMLVQKASLDAATRAALAQMPKSPLWFTAWMAFVSSAASVAQCMFLYGAIQEPFRRTQLKQAGILVTALISSALYPLVYICLNGRFYPGMFTAMTLLPGLVTGAALAVIYHKHGDLKVPLLGRMGANLVGFVVRWGF